MLIDILVGKPWLVAVLWGVLSIFDFAATMLYSKAYREFLSANITYEGGMEMNPAFEKDVQQLTLVQSALSCFHVDRRLAHHSSRLGVSDLVVRSLGRCGYIVGAHHGSTAYREFKYGLVYEIGPRWFQRQDTAELCAFTTPHCCWDFQHRHALLDRLLFSRACVLSRRRTHLRIIRAQTFLVVQTTDTKIHRVSQKWSGKL